jgi:hypothetical protein
LALNDGQSASPQGWLIGFRTCQEIRNRGACLRGISVRHDRMLRLTELKLPLDHSGSALCDAVLTTLGIPSEDLLSPQFFSTGSN